MRKERPILFSGPMVRAILDGRKTQTRRAITSIDVANACTHANGATTNAVLSRCPFGKKGDFLWVRETWHPHKSCKGPASYRATWPLDDDSPDDGWCSPLFMPRWASRITLEIADVRVERLKEITEEDALAEGAVWWHGNGCSTRDHFRQIWDSINAKRGFSWSSNPWVWVIHFKRV